MLAVKVEHMRMVEAGDMEEEVRARAVNADAVQWFRNRADELAYPESCAMGHQI